MATKSGFPARSAVVVAAFAARPRLLAAIALGLAVGTGLALGARLAAATSVILGWDAGSLTFILLSLTAMRGGTAAQMRARAARDDEGRAVILALVLLAAAVSVGAVAEELSMARSAGGAERALRVALAFATVAVSWVTVQLTFAVHYAHAYYQQDGDGDARGLRFPGEGEPDYWDFLHFSVIIGIACQTADIDITSKPLRRLNTAHGLFAFVFNTLIVALTINLLAGLF